MSAAAHPPSGTRTLSESGSKALLAGFGVPFAPERLVADPTEAASAAARSLATSSRASYSSPVSTQSSNWITPISVNRYRS